MGFPQAAATLPINAADANTVDSFQAPVFITPSGNGSGAGILSQATGALTNLASIQVQGANQASNITLEALDTPNVHDAQLSLNVSPGTLKAALTMTGTGHGVFVFGDDGTQPKMAFYTNNLATAVAKQSVTGSKGANAALTSLMTALNALGLVTDNTT